MKNSQLPKVVHCKNCIHRRKFFKCPLFQYDKVTDDWYDETYDNGFCEKGEDGNEEQRFYS